VKQNFWQGVVLLTAALLIAACSGIPRRDRDKEALEQYLQYAGPPVDHISTFNHYNGWQAVGYYQVVLWSGVDDAYLVTVSAPCENLQFANRIGVTQTSDSIYTKFDALLVHGWRCNITEIRPINYLQMRQDQREQRALEKARAKAPDKDG